MAKLESIKVEITRYAIVFFPVATYTKVGDISFLTILGIQVYSRIGERRCVLGVFSHAS